MDNGPDGFQMLTPDAAILALATLVVLAAILEPVLR